jgi:pimeloyl-ACP methyl ester carboxylesterase
MPPSTSDTPQYVTPELYSNATDIDLWGRGYSDTPADLPHDTRLFATGILLAITSSPLSWTGAGSGRFSIVGCSLGGGIAASFTSHFPRLVNSLVLLAPAGLIRPEKFTLTTKFLYSTGLSPEALLRYLVERRMRTSKDSSAVSSQVRKKDDKVGAGDAVASELSNTPTSSVTMSEAYPDVNVPASVVWQINHHQGFLTAFMSSIRHAPISGQHADWRP